MPPPRPRTGTWISSGVPRGGPVATALMVVMVPVTLVWSGPSWATVAGGAVEVVVGPARGRELWWPGRPPPRPLWPARPRRRPAPPDGALNAGPRFERRLAPYELTTSDSGAATGIGMGVGSRKGRGSTQRGGPHRRGTTDSRRGGRLRGDGPPAAGERAAGRPRRDLPRGEGPGQDQDDPLPHRPARRMEPDRGRLGDQRRPLPPHLPPLAGPHRRAGRGHPDRVGPPRPALR